MALHVGIQLGFHWENLLTKRTDVDRVVYHHVLHETLFVFELLGAVWTVQRLLVFMGTEVESQMSQFLEGLPAELTGVWFFFTFRFLLLPGSAEMIFKEFLPVKSEVADAADVGGNVLVISQNVVLEHPGVKEGFVADVTLRPLLVHVCLHVLDQATFKLEYAVTLQTLVVILSCLGGTPSNSFAKKENQN